MMPSVERFNSLPSHSLRICSVSSRISTPSSMRRSKGGMQTLQDPREPHARCDPPPAQYADLETGGGAKVPLMPNAALLAARSEDQADATARAFAVLVHPVEER